MAQRYHTSRTRGGSSTTQATLLASHYNINLNKVVTLASPFLRSISPANAPARDKATSARAVLPVYATDLGRLARGEGPVDAAAVGSSPAKGKGRADDSKDGSWDAWGGAWISFYVNPKSLNPPAAAAGPPRDPATPTPTRRSSLHHHTHPHPPHSGLTPHPPPAGSASRARVAAEDVVAQEPVELSSVTSGLQTLEVPYGLIRDSPNLEDVVKSAVTELPADSHYDILHRLRVAKALSGDVASRRRILAVRILALINLAFVFTEQQFQQKILLLDQDEPRRLQLAYQLAELVQGGDKPGKGAEVPPKWLQTLALGGLEALARHKTKTADVCTALSVNVNHGVLLYLMRRAVVDLGNDNDDGDVESEEWREALFSLVAFLPGTTHTGSSLVSAGIIPILIDLINLRTKKAFRHIPKALSILDQLLYGVPNAFQSFADAKGLEAVVDLASYETLQGLEEVSQGKGIPDNYRTEQTDYKISHSRQQTLKMVTKFMQHMMAQSGTGVDRLLRNLVDNPKLLEAIKLVVAEGPVWGSHIWSTVVGMISAFIHNEPTSYAVIHEAHITHSFLEAITGKTGLAEEEAKRKEEEEAKKAREEEEAQQKKKIEEAERQQQTQQGQEEAERPSSEAQPGSSSSGEQATLVVPHNGGGAPSDEPTAVVGTEGRAVEAKAPEEKAKSSEVRPPAEFPPAVSRIMASADAISSIPTALGAFCLNPLGLSLIQNSCVLDSFFEIFESPAHLRILIEGELDNLLGTQFDELVRHHPDLREDVLNSTLRMLDRVIEIGKKYAIEYGVGAKVWLDDDLGGLVVSGGRKALAGSDPAAAPAPSGAPGPSTSSDAKVNNEGEDVEMDGTHAVPAAVATGGSGPDGSPVGQVVTLADLKYEEAGAAGNKLPPITDYIDVAARYLEGFITNTTQTRELLRRGGLDKLLECFSLPSLPYDFATSQANQTLCRTIHLCCESELAGSLKAVVACAQKAVDRLQPFLEHSRKEPFFAPLTNPDSKDAVAPLGGQPPADDQKSGDDFQTEAERQAVENVKANGTTLVKDLVTMHALCYLLHDLYHQSMFNVRQSVQIFLQGPQDQNKEGLIVKLGALQRQCVWEEIQLQKGIPADWDEATRTKASATNAAAAIDETAATAQPSSSGSSGDGQADTPLSSEQKKEAQKAVVEKDGKTSWFRNVKTIRYLIGQTPTSINPFLQGISLSFFPHLSTFTPGSQKGNRPRKVRNQP